MLRWCALASVCLLLAGGAAAQDEPATLLVEVRADGVPVEGADVVVRGLAFRTDATGRVTVRAAPGTAQVVVIAAGFATERTAVTLGSGIEQTLLVGLHPPPVLDEQVTVVAATRSNRRIEDHPLRVEVLGREEIEEKMLMTPGDIVMMLNELGGMRIQVTAPSLGAASLRIQGMRGRYTRVLSDGLPLYGDVGGLGLLQIPPMDLGQVEAIKGVSSALHGAGALGGVINLLARRTDVEPVREGLVNWSSRGATDATAFVGGPIGAGWSGSVLAGGHWHDAHDVSGDGWADTPGYARAVLRPRMFLDAGEGRTLFATAGFTHETREGGTIATRVLEVTGRPYRQSLDTTRVDAGLVGQLLLRDRLVLTARGSAVRQDHDHRFGEHAEGDRHDTFFAEAAIRGLAGRGIWVAGTAIERDRFVPHDVPQFAYTFTVPGFFAQYDMDVTPAFSITSSARLDVHSEYGTFVSPRVSALTRFGGWTGRASVGTGFFASTPLTEETDAAGLRRLELDEPLRAERAISASFDLSRTDGPLSYTATIFTSRIVDPVHADRGTRYAVRQLTDPSLNAGLELLGVLRQEPWAITATYTWVRARETVDGQRVAVPLTPAHSLGVIGMWELDDVARVGVEWYYTGRQRLIENPYRTHGEPYLIVGLLAERWFGHVALFINGENLTDVRQTRWDSLLRPWRGPDGRWTVDAWAPLEGRTINGGLRFRF
jgi:outer membrane receptor for ferrienterochelin and colicins